MSSYYQQEGNTDRYTLEDDSGFLLMEDGATWTGESSSTWTFGKAVAGYATKASSTVSTWTFGKAVAGFIVVPIEGFSLAFGAAWDEEYPTWTRIDDNSTSYTVQSVDIKRGRAYEFDRTDAGTMTIKLVDKAGVFDPTNTTSAFYGALKPRMQAGYGLENPVTSEWHTIYRGFVSSIRWEPYQTERFANVTIECDDGLAMLAAAELSVDGTFGTTPPRDGDIYYPEDTATDAVQTRINAVLDDVGWPANLRQIFTGNVKIQETIYPPRTTALQVIDDAADAEFPGVSNRYVNAAGHMTFHGRLARFDPEGTATDTDWDFTDWELGDDAAVASDPANIVRISPPLEVFVDDENLFTSAIATPKGIDDGDIAGQYVEDATARAELGLRTWSAEDLLTLGGAADATALEVTALFSDYYRDNYASPKTRIGQITVKPVRPSDTRGAATWALLTGIDISDRVTLTTTHYGGGGFAGDQFFVEGVTYTITPHDGTHPMVVLGIDASPTSYYDANPFA